MRIKRSFTDEELFLGMRRQDRSEILYLYKKFRPMVRWMIITKGGNSKDAKDIFQDTIIILLKLVQRAGFKQRCKMKTLIFAIASYQWKNKSRQRLREVPFHPLKHDCVEEEPFPSADEIEIYENVIWSSFSVLPETCQKVLLLHWEGFNPREIAEKLNCKETYIRKRKSTCLQRFASSFRSHKDFSLLSISSQALSLEYKES